MPNPIIALVIDNAQVAYDLGDLAQLERDARLALAVSRRTGDGHGLAVATLFLGLARRDLALLECAARSFELCHDWHNTALAWCICSEYADQAGGLACLSRALEHVGRAKRGFAQRGDTSRWQAARDLERAIHEAGGRLADGCRWVEIGHAGSVVYKKEKKMKDLTVKENALEMLKSSASEADWNTACSAIKKANGGYPSWWYQEVVASGLARQVAAGWGGDADIHISVG